MFFSQLVGVACLYLAGKLDEPVQLKIRDLMNVSHDLLRTQEEEKEDTSLLSLDSYYYNLRENICQTELLVLRMVNFEVR